MWHLVMVRNLGLTGQKMTSRGDTDPPKVLPTLHLTMHQYDPVGKYKCRVFSGPEPRRGTALFRSAVGPKPDQLRGSRRIFKAYGHV